MVFIVLLLISIVLTLLIIYMIYNIIYWFFQPKVLIYQFEYGVVIKRNIKINYTEIENVYYKNYWHKDGRFGKYYKNQYIGTICIQLKSGKIYKIKNASYPFMVVDELLKIKKQKKHR